MNQSVLKFWYLKEPPFNNDISLKKFFYRSKKYDEIINRIIRGVQEQNTDITMIYGDVGTGKSFTSAIIKDELSEFGSCYVLYYPTAYGNFETLLCKIVRDVLTDEKPNNITEATLLFEDILDTLQKQNSQLIIILDECHAYGIKQLDEIRQLSNYNAKSLKKVLSLILVGQSELLDMVSQMKQLNSRIKERQHLTYLKEEEIEPYIHFKILTAGFNKKRVNPFVEHSKGLLKVTLGMPRLINNVCEAALEIAAAKGERFISQETFKEAVIEKFGREDGVGKGDEMEVL